MIIKFIMQLGRFTNGIFFFWQKTQMHCFGQVWEDQFQITIIENDGEKEENTRIESTPRVYTRSTKDGRTTRTRRFFLVRFVKFRFIRPNVCARLVLV